MSNKELKQNINALAGQVKQNKEQGFNSIKSITDKIKENQAEIKSILLNEKYANKKKTDKEKEEYRKNISSIKSNTETLNKSIKNNFESQEKIKNSITNLDDRLSNKILQNGNQQEEIKQNIEKEFLRIEKKTENIVNIIEKNITDKIKEIKLFKASEEMLENNPYGLAIVQELTKKAFKVEEKQYQSLSNKLKEKEQNIKQEYLKLNSIKSFGEISSVKLQDKISKMQNIYHEKLRQSKSDNDDANIEAQAIKHTIEFINLCIKKL